MKFKSQLLVVSFIPALVMAQVPVIASPAIAGKPIVTAAEEEAYIRQHPLVFTGKGAMPIILTPAEEVSQNPNAIGYISKGDPTNVPERRGN